MSIQGSSTTGRGGLDLVEIVRLAYRSWFLILVCVGVAAAVAYAASTAQDEEYTASASLLFRGASLEQALLDGTGSSGPVDPNRTAGTNVTLIELPAVAERTAQRLGDVTAADVSDAIEVQADDSSNVVTISATWSDPGSAVRMANAVAEAYVRFQRDTDRAAILEAVRLVERRLRAFAPEDRSREAEVLRGRLNDLNIRTALQTGNASLVQRAPRPTAPSAPAPRRNALIGAVLGLFLGVALVVGRARFDRRVREPDQITDVLGEPPLATVPRLRSEARGHPAFEMLFVKVQYFNVDRTIRSLLVMSAGEGEGKSTVALELGRAAARTGSSVVVVDADLRSPSLGRLAGVPSRPGLAEVLVERASLESALQEVGASHERDDHLSSGLCVLPAGLVPPNPVQLLASVACEQLLKRLQERFDLVIIDTPPASIFSDAIPLIELVDGVIVIAGLGRTSRDALKDFRDQLRSMGAPMLGVVANLVRKDDQSYAAYGYGRERQRV